jgi:hypothetical protein
VIVILVLLLELVDQLRSAWKAIVDGYDRERRAAAADPTPSSQRRAF